MCWIGNMGHVAGGWWLHSVEVFPLVYLTSSSRTLISYRFHQVFLGSFLDIGYEEDIPKSCLHQRWALLFQALELWDLIGFIRIFGLISGFQIWGRHSEVSSSSEMGLPLRSSRILEFSQIPSGFWYFLWYYNIAEMVEGEFLNFGITYWNYEISWISVRFFAFSCGTTTLQRWFKVSS